MIRTFTLLRDLVVINAPIPTEIKELTKILNDPRPPWRILKAGTVVTMRPLRSLSFHGREIVSLECIVEGETMPCSYGASIDFESVSGFPLSELDPPAIEIIEFLQYDVRKVIQDMQKKFDVNTQNVTLPSKNITNNDIKGVSLAFAAALICMAVSITYLISTYF